MDHHALLVEGRNSSIEEIFTDLPTAKDAEQYVFPHTTIGINEVKQLITDSYLTPREGFFRVIVVESNSMTVEAQNALLKLLEEPPVSTRFVFIVRPGVTLLPTLRSRFFVVSQSSEPGEYSTFDDFMLQGIADRLTAVADRIEKKDEVWIRSIRSGLTNHLAVDFKKFNYSSDDLETISLILSRLGTRGASAKMLLEELSLLLPVGVK